VDARDMERAIRVAGERAPGDIERRGTRVDTVQSADTRRDQRSPPPGAAPKVEADSACRGRLRREDGEVLVECPCALGLREVGLVEPAPLGPEALDGRR